MMLKCAYCGCEFLKATDRGRPPKYCSPECRMEADKANKRTQYVGKRENVCKFCGTKLPKYKTRFCCNDCKDKWHRIQKGVVQSYEPIEKVCICCGKTFYTYKQSVNSCSAECVKAHRKERKNEKAKNRRYKLITVDKDITLKGVALRDNQECQLCGGVVDWNDYEIINGNMKCGSNYPSIDHIVPISLGGMHSWGNVQLAHMICNSRKGNKMIG